MRKVKAKRNGTLVEVTSVVQYDAALLEARITQLTRDVKAYDMQIDFISGKRLEAQTELDQLKSLQQPGQP